MYVLMDADALVGTFDSVTPLGTYVAPGTGTCLVLTYPAVLDSDS